MNKFNTDLRNYLQQNHNLLTWKERIQIAQDIISALNHIHLENAIHRDLHSGNTVYYIFNQELVLVILDFVDLQTYHQ